jgi:hypothetical protein
MLFERFQTDTGEVNLSAHNPNLKHSTPLCTQNREESP